ncbi:chemotaxis response regulator protein-glutamate methylesterase [bacterium BMS3Abin07]|nr:chemotaxis response regulator protein-glutamate methylesterase [bacterium BMS3Abin07]HDL21087.1 chemotaxis response regulator protein-glutamate methylesterase [Nitrospirota bacterium]HDO23025.1 chemotaxis response regulator protein-glutamate methylesterase [Nitrospirota bacterium]HDZ87311.1 chemotaxis response regulator protein-glutamate methylesterase [Nitrospirota bacterium]
MAGGKTGVLIVDDSAYSRQTIKKMLEKDSNMDVLAVATDGVDAMGKTIRLKPDIITLDFEMPGMDGFAFLRWVMKEQPTPVIMVSSYSDSGTVFKALELGAVDFIAKPARKASDMLMGIENDLLLKVRNIKKPSLNKLRNSLELISETEKISADIPVSRSSAEVIAIGASTGGPAALQYILTRLPHEFPSAMLISQHMPKGFTKSLAQRLNKMSGISVKEAGDNEPIVPSTAYICPGGSHLTVRKKRNCYYTKIIPPSRGDKYVPSVDIMMTSVAASFGKRAIGVILTGMGDDGKRGMLEIRKKNGYTIAESEKTAVIYGMPREVVNSGGAEKIKPLHDIPKELVRILERN